jgi:hypothetical protein
LRWLGVESDTIRGIGHVSRSVSDGATTFASLL